MLMLITAPPLLLDKPLYNILLPRTTSILIDWWVLHDAEPVKIQDVPKSKSCVLTSFISTPFIFDSQLLGSWLPDMLDFDWFRGGVRLDYQPLFGKWARAREQRNSSLQRGMKTIKAVKTYGRLRVRTLTPFSFSLSATSRTSTGTDH